MTTTAGSVKAGRLLMEQLGFPFRTIDEDEEQFSTRPAKDATKRASKK